MAISETHAVFEATAAGYDRDRMKLIPDHERFYSTALAAIPKNADHILDLGAGTGLFTAMIRAQHPDAHIHLIDNSGKMLEQAKERFRHDQDTVFQLGDYTSAAWGSQYDTIASALSIHHLDDHAKRTLFARIFEALQPGGVFVNAEQVAMGTPEDEHQAKANWLAEIRQNGATEQQIEDSLVRQQADRCATTLDQLQWLREAGFIDVAAPYERGRFAVITARKPL